MFMGEISFTFRSKFVLNEKDDFVKGHVIPATGPQDQIQTNHLHKLNCNLITQILATDLTIINPLSINTLTKFSP